MHFIHIFLNIIRNFVLDFSQNMLYIVFVKES